MFRTILIDDEELSLEQLSYVLDGQQDIEISGAYTDPVEALADIKVIQPDVLFIDVSMPCINGFQLAKEIQDEGMQPYIIFVTAYRDYAINAFEVEAIDYIQKPFLGNRIDEALNKIRRRVALQNTKHRQHSRETEAKSLADKDRLNWFPVEENESIVLLHVDEVYYCTVDNKTTLIYTRDRCYPITYTLSKIEENYSSKLFFRCHKSFVVNLNYVEKIIPLFKQNHIIILRDINIEIPVSRHYVKRLKRLLNLDTPR